MSRLISHALTVLSLLAITSGCASADTATVGSIWMGVASVRGGVEFRFSSGMTKLNPENSFGADAVLLSHDYYRLTAEQVTALETSLDAWRKAPHSLTVYSSNAAPGEAAAFVVGGSALGTVPVVVVEIQWWSASGTAHHHGGPYVALTPGEVSSLLTGLQAWSSGTTSDGFVFQVQR